MKVGEVGVAWFSYTSICLFVLCDGQLESLQITFKCHNLKLATNTIQRCMILPSSQKLL